MQTLVIRKFRTSITKGDFLLLQSNPEYDGQCDEFKLHDLDNMCLYCDYQVDSPIYEGELAGNIFEVAMLLGNDLR